MIVPFEVSEGKAEAPKSEYAFVDADNIARGLDSLLRRSGVDQSDFHCFSLRGYFDQAAHKRVFVYSGKDENDAMSPWIEDIQAHDGYVVRAGRTTVKGKQKKQQGVDVKLAVDAMQHAVRRTMSSCTIYSGDGDFIPLVDALVEEGVIVSVSSFSNPSKGEVAPTLRAKADRYTYLAGHETFNNLTSGFFKRDVFVNRQNLDRLSNTYFEVSEEMVLSNETFRFSTRDGLRVFVKSREDPKNGFTVRFRSKRQMKLWIQVALPSLDVQLHWPDEF